MRGRLFWKILIGFGLTFIAIAQGVWLLFQFYGQPPVPYAIGYLLDVAPGYTRTAAMTAETRGAIGLQQLIATWPDAERKRISVEPVDLVRTLSERPTIDALKAQGEIVRDVITPSGDVIRIRFDVRDIVAGIPDRHKFNIPQPMLIAGVVGGLVFSALLAWYLTRPILQLRAGFQQLAAGDMACRLGPVMGRRRDEIADLARDFDVMAGRLQQLIAVRDRLLNDVSHELRSPLARMQLAVGLARQKPEKIPATLDRIEKETARLDELVGELLTLSRVESGVAHHQNFMDIDSLLGRVVSDARFEAEASGIIVTTCNLVALRSHNGNAPMVSGNAELLRRAFENIIRNALRHSKDGQEVAISLAADFDRHSLAVTIADQGPGIAPDRMENIFDPFVRGDGEGAGAGFGLGLAIARRAIAAHGGNITMQNRAQGGLEVTITLPFTEHRAGD
ncbi:ATP-binding protein [Thalassospira sp.]|uniref:ATP-binding protein n=1 Tax=Thalassospira sp. TaxID=1912094 RepID=UPI0027325D45|nr:ATP-binding protein [Thalassospira sp.]MDP2700354.1 ATP-binding protein [Thalassospira sp.]